MIKISQEHNVKYKELIDNFEQMVVIVNQLATGDYTSFDVYLNSYKKYSIISHDSMLLLSDKSFEIYLMNYNAPLFYSINGLNMSFGMMNNFLKNMNKVIRSME